VDRGSDSLRSLNGADRGERRDDEPKAAQLGERAHGGDCTRISGEPDAVRRQHALSLYEKIILVSEKT
jgi:hypothetical protein